MQKTIKTIFALFIITITTNAASNEISYNYVEGVLTSKKTSIGFAYRAADDVDEFSFGVRFNITN